MALPAASGFLDFLNKFKDPKLDIYEGRCGKFKLDLHGEHNSQSIKSISWHDFVNKDGAVVDSLRQLPLPVGQPCLYRRF